MKWETYSFSRSNNIIDRKIGDTRYILHCVSGEIVEFNPTAEFIWETIECQRNLYEIALEVSNQFRITKESATNVLLEFLPKLYLAGLVKIDGEEFCIINPIDKAIQRPKFAAKLWQTAISAIVPLKVDLELTYACNLSCEYCYSKNNHTGNTLTSTQIKKLISEIRSQGCIFLTLTGGEPLIRTDIIGIMEHAKNENLLVRLLTNGTMVTPSLAKEIANIGSVSVEISLHNLDPICHDKFTNIKGSFNKAITSAQLFREIGVNVAFKFTVTKENFDCLKRIKQYSQMIGIPFITNTIIFPRLDGSSKPLLLSLSDEQLRNAIEEGTIVTETYECISGKAKCTISPDGQVYPCEFIRIGMGNIATNGFDHIWNSDNFSKFRISPIFEKYEQCNDCESSSYCQRCPGLVYLEKGTYNNKFSQACRIAHIASSVHSIQPGIAEL